MVGWTQIRSNFEFADSDVPLCLLMSRSESRSSNPSFEVFHQSIILFEEGTRIEARITTD